MLLLVVALFLFYFTRVPLRLCIFVLHYYGPRKVQKKSFKHEVGRQVCLNCDRRACYETCSMWETCCFVCFSSCVKFTVKIRSTSLNWSLKIRSGFPRFSLPNLQLKLKRGENRFFKFYEWSFFLRDNIF